MSAQAHDLRAAFETVEPLTVGLEEEVMLLDPGSFELAERAPELLARLEGDARFKLELPRSQLELITPPQASVPAALRELAVARARLADAADGLVSPVAAGAHPFSAQEGALNDGTHYEHTAREYASVARRQLVCALQVHVAVGGAERTLAVYNELRAHLPLLAALAANAPFHGGRDSGLASVRPTICDLLPRQGIPPALASWEQLAEELRWGADAGVVPTSASWWWELRPHPRFGTLELRVPDAQTTLLDVAGVVALAHTLVAWLVERYEAGERGDTPPTWRIEENRWSACRHGVEGSLADLRSGERRPTRELLDELLDALEPTGQRLGADRALAQARRLVRCNGALAQRAVAEREGPRGLAAWLVKRFAEPGLD